MTARLIYSALTSLDGYVEDEQGKFDWAAPDEEVHAFVNELERTVGTYLYGRRIYDTMRFWETAGMGPDEPAVIREFAELWRPADKVVYSRTLQEVSSARTRTEREFDPAAVRLLKETATRDITIGGPELAGQAIAAGLVDECHPVHRAGARRRRQARAPCRRPQATRAARRASVRERGRSSPLPLPSLTSAQAASLGGRHGVDPVQAPVAATLKSRRRVSRGAVPASGTKLYPAPVQDFPPVEPGTGRSPAAA